MHNVSALLLAAGRSTRMGLLKGLLPWQGKPLIEWQIMQLQQSLIDDIIVILGYKAEQYEPLLHPYKVKTVINSVYNQGKTSSILKGLEVVTPKTEEILITAVDQPLNVNTINHMIRYMKHSGKAIVIPVHRGKRGHPILFSASLMKSLSNINENTKGLKHVIRTYSEQIAEMDTDDSYVLYNFNYPRDYVFARNVHKEDMHAYTRD